MTPSPLPASCSLPEPALPPGLNLRLEPFGRRHLAQMTAIEQENFANPWSRALFVQEMTIPWSLHRVALGPEEGQVVGFVVVWLVAGEAQVQNLAVAPEFKRRGVGRWLLLTALAEAKGLGARICNLEVRANNHAALGLYESLGFVRQGVRPRYYQPENEDAILMGRDL